MNGWRPNANRHKVGALSWLPTMSGAEFCEKCFESAIFEQCWANSKICLWARRRKKKKNDRHQKAILRKNVLVKQLAQDLKGPRTVMIWFLHKGLSWPVFWFDFFPGTLLVAIDKLTIEMMLETRKEESKGMAPFYDTVIRKMPMPRENRETVWTNQAKVWSRIRVWPA